jgi:nitrogen-specific signal transduction histidine kinase
MKVREKAEHDLARINQDLALLNKDKDRLFTILAHDLRSPLGSMMKLSELLAENIKDFDENELLEVITALNKSSIQTFQLLNDLLAWSAVQMGKGITVKEHFLLADVVNESITSVAQDADAKNIRVQSGINPEIIIFADKFAIMTVIRNLLSNAVKFTGHEGCVDVRADQETGVVKISVTDNGLGISKEKQEKIFRVDSLSSTPGTDGEKGTGFGLLLCKDLVQKNDGEIWLESETGKGSTFFISLPSDKIESLVATQPNLNSEGRIELRYDHARKLGFSTFIGEFNFSLFNSELHRIWSSPDYKPAYSILIDVRQASISSENKDFKEIISLFRNMPGTGTKKKFALLTTTPQQVAYSTIFGQDMMSKYPFEIEVFSTTEAALKWLV